MDYRGFVAVLLSVEGHHLPWLPALPHTPLWFLTSTPTPGLSVVLLIIWPERPHKSFGFVYLSFPSRRPVGFNSYFVVLGEEGAVWTSTKWCTLKTGFFKPENILHKSSFGVRQTWVHFFFLIALLRYNLRIIKFTILKCITAIYSELCTHHHDLILEKFHHPQKKPCIWGHTLTLPFHSRVTT